jgi:hypothetical protein
VHFYNRSTNEPTELTNEPTEPTDRPTNQPTNSVELSPSQETAKYADTQELLNISWNPKDHYCVHMSL